MFGIDDPAIYLGYLLTFLSLILCIIYGALNWNKGGELESSALEMDEKWEAEEEKIESQL